MARHRAPIDYFQTSSGRCPVIEFMGDIDRGNPGARAKCLTALDMLAEGSLPAGRAVKVHNDPSIWELRVKHKGQEYRLMFGRNHDIYVVCNGLHKKTQKIPRRIIDQAGANFKAHVEG